MPGNLVGDLEAELDDLWTQAGGPADEEFKWSPGPDLWMHSNLVGQERTELFVRALRKARNVGAKVTVVIEDIDSTTATGARTAEMDVTTLLMERVNSILAGVGNLGLVVTDRPSGDRKAEDFFLAECLEMLYSGTEYVQFDRIALNVLSTPSKLVRILQLADVVTSCTTAMVAGEVRFSPPVFAAIKRLMESNLNRFGGYGLKLHPDYRYANLYHWLLGDSHLVRGSAAVSFPLPERPYHSGPNEP